jgi:hypothetical protein
MNVQNNYDTSDFSVFHSVTNRLNPLNCWYDYLMHKKPVPNSCIISLSTEKKKCILLLVRCHRPPIWPPALPLNLTHILIVLSDTVTSIRALYKLLTFPSPKYQIHIPSLKSLIQRIVHVRGSFTGVCFLTGFFYAEVLAPCPIRKLEDHPMSFVRGCFFSIFAGPSATRRSTMLWWQGTHLTWLQ